MNRLLFAGMGLTLGSMLAGCGQNNTPTAPTAQAPALALPAAPSEKAAPAADPNVIPQNLDPKQTIAHYLEAVKDGNEKRVTALLTDVARRKTAEARIAVAPPGSETAVYSVGTVEFVTADKTTAHVASTWTDMDENEKPQTLPIVWVVRQEPAGWRVAGMMTRTSPGQPMLVLNFEEPAEVLRISEEEIARRQGAREKEAPAQTAGTTEGPEANQPTNTLRQARGTAESDPANPR